MEDSPAPALSLGGNIAEFPLADVLTFLNMGLKTGAIEVLSGGAANRIFLKEGEVVFSRSKNPKLQLSRFLVQRGLLTEHVAKELESRADHERRAFRDLVVEAGLIDEEEMRSYEKILCSEIVFEAMAWREGKFAFLADRRPEGINTLLRISIPNLIMEGARRLDESRREERERLEREMEIGRDSLVTLVCSTGRLEDQVVLTPSEWGVIALINGKRTLAEIFSLSPISEPDSWLALQRLQAARLIQIHPRTPEAKREEPQERSQEVAISSPKLTTLLDAIPLSPSAPPEDPAERATVVAMPPRPPDQLTHSDVRLITGEDVTTSHGMFGTRLPARLVSASDSGEPAVAFDLTRPVQTIGRSDSNDVVLPHQSVSKQHAQILQDGDGWRLVDLKSTNGTRVNGEKVPECRLSPGDRIQIGAYAFHFDAVAFPARRSRS